MPTTVALYILLAALSGASGASPGLRLQILDESGRPVAARVQVFDRNGTAEPVQSASSVTLAHPKVPAMGIVASGQLAIEIPTATSKVRVERGGEYLPVEIDVTASAVPAERTVRLRRWIDMASKGWWSGDMHVHRFPADMPLLMEASDLHFAPTITRWNENSSLDTWPEQSVYRVGPDRAYSIDNCEDERGWGAALFFSVKSPLKLYSPRTQNEYPPPLPVWQEARQRGGFIDLEKTIWWGAPVIAALVPPDAVGVAVNHFIEWGVVDTEAWGRPRDRDKYPGARGFAHYIFDLYYYYLNSGRRIPASAGSANGVLHNPLGYNRSYVYLGKRFSYEDWLAGHKAGRNFVTNGPMLFLRVNGKLPGAVIEGSDVVVELEALTAGELEKVELIVGGAILDAWTPGTETRFKVSKRLRVRPGGWVAARCFEKCPVTIRFAHTSPVYFGRKPMRTPEALEFMRAWIDAEMGRIRELSSLSEAERAELLKLCVQARETYH